MSHRYKKVDADEEDTKSKRFGDTFVKGRRATWGKGWRYSQTDLETPPDKIYQPKEKELKLGSEEMSIELTKRVLSHKLPMWKTYATENIKRIMARTGPSKKDLQKLHFTALRDDFIIKPCMILGYGPSFHANVHKLKGLDLQKCNLIATDRTLPILRDHGIVPQYASNLDSGDQILPFYRDVDTRDITALFALTTNPHAWEWFKGPKYWYSPAIYPWNNQVAWQIYDLTGFYSIPSCGNVGTVSMMLAFILGAAPIFLLGMDFAYDPEKQVADLNAEKALKIIECGDGTRVKTDPTLVAYASSTRRILMNKTLCDAFMTRPLVNLSGGLLRGPFIREATFDVGLAAINSFEVSEWENTKHRMTLSGSIRNYLMALTEGRENDVIY